MYFGITDSSQMIDVDTINALCNQLENVAIDFLQAANKVVEAKYYISGDSMRVDNLTMEENYEKLNNYCQNLESQINGYAEQIRATANEIYGIQSFELQEYAKAQQNK